jgi:hypothetical protein
MSERGEISLTGLLVAMSIFMAVLGATLTTFEAFDSQASALARRTDVQDTARRGADRIARDLRNLAGPKQTLPDAVEVAAPSDLVFNTVDTVKPAGSLNGANVKRVRYCLEPASRKIWQQEQRWTQAAEPAVPSTTACPSPAWGGATQVMADVVNVTRPIFTYDTTVTTSISTVNVDLFVDDQPGTGPPETKISTGVFLRNQNRLPEARFTATPTAQGVLLNGSASRDPEGQPLTYVWYAGGTEIGRGVTFLHVTSTGTSHAYSLRVFDPAGLGGTSSAPETTP